VFQFTGSSRRVVHELHIHLPGTTKRPAAFKLPQKTHFSILASAAFISEGIRHCRRNWVCKIFCSGPPERPRARMPPARRGRPTIAAIHFYPANGIVKINTEFADCGSLLGLLFAGHYRHIDYDTY